MFVNCFTITMTSRISEIAMKELFEEFGKNIPKSSAINDGYLYFITHLFCVEENINIEEICKKI